MKYKKQVSKIILIASHPSRGAWIEIEHFILHIPGEKVAPLTGCVD